MTIDIASGNIEINKNTASAMTIQGAYIVKCKKTGQGKLYITADQVYRITPSDVTSFNGGASPTLDALYAAVVAIMTI